MPLTEVIGGLVDPKWSVSPLGRLPLSHAIMYRQIIFNILLFFCLMYTGYLALFVNGESLGRRDLLV